MSCGVSARVRRGYVAVKRYRLPILVILLAAWLAWGTVATATPTVWSGLSTSFSKLTGTDPLLPENEDHLTSHVALTRADIGGIFNSVLETSVDRDNRTSPLDTAWATDINNPSDTIQSSNWATLSFTTWNASYGSMGGVGANIVNRDAVVHLITDDIYLDLRFTAWGGNQGGFAYLRSSPPAPTGDYNGNHVVDTADYTIWRDAFGQSVAPGTGADGNGNGMIDGADYDFWRSHFGTVASASASESNQSLIVSEPATVVLLACLAMLVTLAHCKDSLIFPTTLRGREFVAGYSK